MKSNLASWIQSKLGQINDQATAQDWAEMEKLIQATPALAGSTPWYKTNWGIGGTSLGALSILIGGLFYLDSENGNGTIDSTVPQEIVVEEAETHNADAISFEKVEANQAGESVSSTQEAAQGSFAVESSVPEEVLVNPSNTSESEPVAEIAVLQASENTETVALSETAPTETLLENNEVAVEEEVNTPTVVESSTYEIQTVQNAQNELEAIAVTEPSHSVVSNAESNPNSEASSMNSISASTTSAESPETVVSSGGVTSSSSSTTPSLATNQPTSSGTNSNSAETGEAESALAEQETSNAQSSEVLTESNQVAGEGDNNEESADSGSDLIEPKESLTDIPAREVNENGSSEDVLRDVRRKNVIHWSTALYGDYSYAASTTEMAGTVLDVQPLGLGTEVRAEWKGWMATLGAAYNRENSSFNSSTVNRQTRYSAVYWYQLDSIARDEIDSVWINQNGGYWQIDTITVYDEYHVQREAQDTGSFFTRSESSLKTEGYRISMPLLIGKQWDIDQFYIGVEAGPVFTSRSTTYFRNGEFSHSKSALGTDLLIRTEFGLHVAKNWSLFGRVGYRTNLTAIKSLRLTPGSMQTVPMSIGARYHF